MPSKERRSRGRRVIAIATCLCLGLFAGFFEKPTQTPSEARRIRMSPYESPSSSEGQSASRIAFKSGPSRRVVYSYSVIPGGVQDGDDLALKMSRDLVVADHYSDFKIVDAVAVKVQDEKLVHVSYRMGNKIFWTSKKVRLARGEKLITDGRNFARARCGNRISGVPQQPTSPEEPLPPLLDMVIVTAEPEPPEKPHAPTKLVAVPRPPSVPYLPLVPVLGGITQGFPDYSSPVTDHDTPVIVPLSPPPPGVPVVNSFPSVPEPGTLVLLASGFGVLALIGVLTRK